MAQVEKLLIFLASPGDVKTERRYTEEVIQELNRTTAAALNLVLDIVKWEEDTIPEYGMDPQAIINKQIAVMEKYELFVGIMWNRFGSPTLRAESGTEEEFNRAVASFERNGRPAIWLYFRNAKASIDSEDQWEQRKKVLALKQKVGTKGLYDEYKTPADFRNKFREDMNKWLSERALKAKTGSEKEGSHNLTGQWIIDDGNSKYDAFLKQEGSHVSGEYDLPGGGTGVIDGTVEGNHLKISWDQKFNQRGGNARMEISADGKELDGKWSYDPEKYSSGRRGGGMWRFYRQ